MSLSYSFISRLLLRMIITLKPSHLPSPLLSANRAWSTQCQVVPIEAPTWVIRPYHTKENHPIQYVAYPCIITLAHTKGHLVQPINSSTFPSSHSLPFVGICRDEQNKHQSSANPREVEFCLLQTQISAAAVKTDLFPIG